MAVPGRRGQHMFCHVLAEAVQIEAQARTSVMYATQRPLPESGRGDYDPPLSGHGGDEESLLALSKSLLKSKVGWW